jgi:serine/threonine protein kinase
MVAGDILFPLQESQAMNMGSAVVVGGGGEVREQDAPQRKRRNSARAVSFGLLQVHARLPGNCPYVGTFHYAPSAGNKSYSFFESSITSSKEMDRLHRIKVHPLTGTFHSRPGHYSKLHGLHNFTPRPGGRNRVLRGRLLDRIRQALTEEPAPSPPPGGGRGILRKGVSTPHLHHLAAHLMHFPTSISDGDLLASSSPEEDSEMGREHYGERSSRRDAPPSPPEFRPSQRFKYQGVLDTHRGRFGNQSLDDVAALGAGARPRRRTSNSRHPDSQDWGQPSEPLIGATSAMLRHMYRDQALSSSASSALLRQANRNAPELAYGALPYHYGHDPMARVPAAFAAAAGEAIRDDIAAPKSLPGAGWESHTVNAQQKTNEYLKDTATAIAPGVRVSRILEERVNAAYEVPGGDEPLGEGAYASVFAAVHKPTGRQVALKRINKRYVFSEAEAASVQREIENQQRLVDQHVIRLYEIYDTPDHIYLVLERARFGTLEELLFVRRRLTELESKVIMKQILLALAYIHSQGVVHCDVKPPNVLFADPNDAIETFEGGLQGDKEHSSGANRTRENEAGEPSSGPCKRSPPPGVSEVTVKLCDFGHSRLSPDVKNWKFTNSIHLIPPHLYQNTGSEGYVAPEVLQQRPYGQGVDIWSAGVILYKMINGREPFLPGCQCLQRPVQLSGAFWDRATPELKDLLFCLLEVDSNLRLTATEALQHPWFEGVAFHEPVAARVSNWNSSFAGAPPKSPTGLGTSSGTEAL